MTWLVVTDRPLRSALIDRDTGRAPARREASWAMSWAIPERSSWKRCGLDASGGGHAPDARGEHLQTLRRRPRALRWIYGKNEGRTRRGTTAAGSCRAGHPTGSLPPASVVATSCLCPPPRQRPTRGTPTRSLPPASAIADEGLRPVNGIFRGAPRRFGGIGSIARRLAGGPRKAGKPIWPPSN